MRSSTARSSGSGNFRSGCACSGMVDQRFDHIESGSFAAAGARNVISGFKVGVFGTGTIQGNYIGTDVSGTAAIPNREFGIQASNSAVIGGTAAAGAGLGAIFGGKKGALIGAAIGGGAGTLFEVKR